MTRLTYVTVTNVPTMRSFGKRTTSVTAVIGEDGATELRLTSTGSPLLSSYPHLSKTLQAIIARLARRAAKAGRETIDWGEL